jgi:hypothetical protein
MKVGRTKSTHPSICIRKRIQYRPVLVSLQGVICKERVLSESFGLSRELLEVLAVPRAALDLYRTAELLNLVHESNSHLPEGAGSGN